MRSTARVSRLGGGRADPAGRARSEERELDIARRAARGAGVAGGGAATGCDRLRRCARHSALGTRQEVSDFWTLDSK